MTSSSARTDFSRPTKSGTIIWGKTTISRSGRTADNWPSAPGGLGCSGFTVDSDIVCSLPGNTSTQALNLCLWHHGRAGFPAPEMGAGQIAAPYFGLRLETKVGCVLGGFKVYPRE